MDSIKSIFYEVKDKTLAKYFLDYFTRKINELTPNINYRKGSFSRFKKIRAIATIKKAGNVIQRAKILADVLVSLSLGIKNWKYPSLYLILRSTKYLNEVVSYQYSKFFAFNSLLKDLSMGLYHLSSNLFGND